jgi:hypothetical protein
MTNGWHLEGSYTLVVSQMVRGPFFYARPFAVKDEFMTADDMLSFEVSPTTVVCSTRSSIQCLPFGWGGGERVDLSCAGLLARLVLLPDTPLTIKWSIRPGARPDSYQYFGVFAVSDTTESRSVLFTERDSGAWGEGGLPAFSVLV